MSNYKALIELVLHLRGVGAIKYDNDIVKSTKYSKSMVSAYMSGVKPPSDDFIETIKKVYSEYLTGDNVPDAIKVKEVEQEYRDEYIKSLVKTIKMQDELLDILRDKLKKYEG